MNIPMRLVLCFSLMGVLSTVAEAAVRIKDITTVRGARGNQLYGVGLVVGLNQTGATFQSRATSQMAIDMLRKMGATTRIAFEELQDNVFRSNSISMVMVTAELPPFAREGSRLNVTVSVMDTATSLKGGTLLLTPMKGADGEVYAVAQGPVSLGGVNLSPFPQVSGQRNHPTSGRVVDGAIVEIEVLGEIEHRGRIQLLLRHPSYATAMKISDAINQTAGRAATNRTDPRAMPRNVADKRRQSELRLVARTRTGAKPSDLKPVAYPIDAGTVELVVPDRYRSQVVEFVSTIGTLQVVPDDPARVVINERTGTVVVGANVRIDAVAIAHGSLVIKPIQPQAPPVPGPGLSSLLGVQPRPQRPPAQQFQEQFLLPGQLPDGDKLNAVPQTYTVTELARALNALGATPKDLISIFQALKESGALHAELVIL